MKKIVTLLGAVLILGFGGLFAQEIEYENPTHPIIDIPNFHIVFTEGISYAQLTRIEKIPDRSNFVRENMMMGAFLDIRSTDVGLFNFETRLSAYYPFYQAFNGMKQTPRNMFNYALDGFFGLQYDFTRLKMVTFNGSLGMHYMYQLTDEWHMHYIGLGGILGFSLPITNQISIVNSNFFSFDDANIGKNRTKQPFDGSYQYHIDLGVRYTKTALNHYYYIDTTNHDQRVEERKQAREEAKKAKQSE